MEQQLEVLARGKFDVAVGSQSQGRSPQGDRKLSQAVEDVLLLLCNNSSDFERISVSRIFSVKLRCLI